MIGILLILLLPTYSEGELKASYNCLIPLSIQIRATYDNGDGYTMMSGMGPDCPFTHDPQKFTFTRTMGIPFQMEKCGLTNVAGSVWIARAVALKAVNGLITSGISIGNINCDFSNPDPVTVNATISNLNISQILTVLDANNTKPEVMMSLWCFDRNSGDYSMTSIPALGQTCFLKANFKPGKQGAASSLVVNQCIASPDSVIDFTPTADSKDRILISNGCGDTSLMKAGIFKGDQTFTWDGEALNSPVFAMFRFSLTAGTVFFYCNFQICYDQKCNEPACPASGRRKRNILNINTEELLNNITGVLTAVQVLSAVLDKQTAGNDANSGSGTTAHPCIDLMMFIVVAVIFAVLLFMVMAMAIFFSYRLTHQTRSYNEQYNQQSHSSRKPK